MVDKLVDALANMREDEALALAQQYLDQGKDPRQVLEFARQAMDVVGERYAKGEYFLPELVLAGEMLTQISAIVKPKLVGGGPEAKKHGKVLIGTVKGDIHDIGKSIVTFMLDANGFDVKDIGIDVPTDKFVAEIKSFQPQVVALSGFLTLAYDSMKETVSAIKDAGLRDKVKIMIGGGQITDKIREYSGADAYGKDAMAAVALAKGWIRLEDKP
jgi:5-methyltetrahydrofolate--homocysteine methyltransferase